MAPPTPICLSISANGSRGIAAIAALSQEDTVRKYRYRRTIDGSRRMAEFQLGRVIDQTVMDRVEGKFEAVGDAKFVEDLCKVMLHCELADIQSCSNLLVCHPFACGLHDLQFALSKAE